MSIREIRVRLSPNQFPFLPECLAAPLAVGDGVEFLYASVVALLRPALVCRAILVLDGEVLLHRLVESQLTFQIVEHCHPRLVLSVSTAQTIPLSAA